MKNFLRLDGRSILSVPYMYIDHKDYLADSLLTHHQLVQLLSVPEEREKTP